MPLLRQRSEGQGKRPRPQEMMWLQTARRLPELRGRLQRLVLRGRGRRLRQPQLPEMLLRQMMHMTVRSMIMSITMITTMTMSTITTMTMITTTDMTTRAITTIMTR